MKATILRIDQLESFEPQSLKGEKVAIMLLSILLTTKSPFLIKLLQFVSVTHLLKTVARIFPA